MKKSTKRPKSPPRTSAVAAKIIKAELKRVYGKKGRKKTSSKKVHSIPDEVILRIVESCFNIPIGDGGPATLAKMREVAYQAGFISELVKVNKLVAKTRSFFPNLVAEGQKACRNMIKEMSTGGVEYAEEQVVLGLCGDRVDHSNEMLDVELAAALDPDIDFDSLCRPLDTATSVDYYSAEALRDVQKLEKPLPPNKGVVRVEKPRPQHISQQLDPKPQPLPRISKKPRKTPNNITILPPNINRPKPKPPGGFDYDYDSDSDSDPVPVK